MKRLSAYRKSKILNIKVLYNKELVSFNLLTEVRINPYIINDQLKTQPGYYGFCLLLHKKLLALFEQLRHDRQAEYGRLYIYAKENKLLNGRPYSDETAKAWVESHSKFKKITAQCIKAREDSDILLAAVKAFEQRKDLLQSLSSNIRKEY